MDDILEKLLLLCLGWALGLLAPVIVDTIRRKRENLVGQAAIQTELGEVAHKLAFATHYIHMHFGSVDREHLDWLKIRILEYKGPEQPTAVLQSVDMQLAMSSDELVAANKALASPTGKGLRLQKYPVPILDSRISALWSFQTTVQRRLLEIRTCLDMLNELVARTQKLDDMTFSKHEDGNHQRVIENIDQCYRLYAERARITVEHIHQLKLEIAHA